MMRVGGGEGKIVLPCCLSHIESAAVGGHRLLRVPAAGRRQVPKGAQTPKGAKSPQGAKRHRGQMAKSARITDL